jgi:hypothetical protein
MCHATRSYFRGGLIWLRSHPIASFPNEKNVGRNQPNHNKHPVLAFKTQKSEMLNEKLHRPAPVFYAGLAFYLCRIGVLASKTYYFYILSRGSALVRERLSSRGQGGRRPSTTPANVGQIRACAALAEQWARRKLEVSRCARPLA